MSNFEISIIFEEYYRVCVKEFINELLMEKDYDPPQGRKVWM